MKIFLTGGAGFVGSHLVESLLKEKLEITVLDNFSNSSISKLEKFREQGIKIINGDITNQELLNQIMYDFDIVIHLAAKISVQDSISNPDETMRVNVQGTECVLKSCVKNNIKNFIAASSAAIFGELDDETKELDEKSLSNPISPYGESKLLMEEKIQEITIKNNINSIILRFFNIYGKGQSDEYAGVITKFIAKTKEKLPVEIYGNGKQKRDFIYIDDVINSIMNSVKNIKGKKSEIYHIGSGKSITILEIAKMILKISNRSEKELNFTEEKKNDIKISQTSVEKAKKELGFKTKIDLKTGLVKIIEN